MPKSTDTVAMTDDAMVNGQAPAMPGPEVLAKIAELRTQVRESFGQVVMAIMNLPRYRHQSIGDVQRLVLEPLIRDRIAIAHPTKEEPGMLTDIAGFPIWASVSEEVDAKIRDQIKAVTFPIRLKPEDWESGSISWLLDVVAPRPQDHGPGDRELPAGGKGRRPPSASPDRRACGAGDAGENLSSRYQIDQVSEPPVKQPTRIGQTLQYPEGRPPCAI